LSGWDGGRRRAWLALAVSVVLAAAGGLVIYRVLAPAEVVTVTGAAYPPPVGAQPGVIGTLAAAPLIVDGRIRVYATTRQLRADGPVDAPTQRSPYWSFRRWPQQLVGAVAVGPMVIGQWSDGHLIAIDAPTGRVAWRAAGPDPETIHYTGRRTGAETVYAPQGLFTATVPGRAVVLAGGVSELSGFDAATGRQLWHTVFEGRLPNCRAGGFTTTGGRFVALDGCEVPEALEFYDAATGRRAARWRPPDAGMSLGALPVACEAGRSECAAMRVRSDGAEQGWLVDGALPVRATGLDPPRAWLVGDVAVEPDERGTELTGRSVRTGSPLWTWRIGSEAGAGRTAVIAAQPGGVHLLTEDRLLITVDPATGEELTRFALSYHREPPELRWRPGYVSARDGFVLVERLAPDAAPQTSDDEYYAVDQPVLLAAT